jgi:hypothetical protein
MTFNGKGGENYMKDSQKTIDAKKAGTVNSIVAGVAGVVAGGIAVAAAVVMSDKKNQKKVSDVLVGAKEKVAELLDTVHSQPITEKSVLKVGAKV